MKSEKLLVVLCGCYKGRRTHHVSHTDKVGKYEVREDTDKVGKYEIREKGWFTVLPGMMITQTQTRWVNMRS